MLTLMRAPGWVLRGRADFSFYIDGFGGESQHTSSPNHGQGGSQGKSPGPVSDCQSQTLRRLRVTCTLSLEGDSPHCVRTWSTGFLCVHAQSLSHVQLFETPWPVAHQAPQSMGLYGQEYWSGLPFPTPVNFPDPGIEPESLDSPALRGAFLTTAPSGKQFFVKIKSACSDRTVGGIPVIYGAVPRSSTIDLHPTIVATGVTVLLSFPSYRWAN